VGRFVVDPISRILDVVFWITAPALFEFWDNPLSETERGEWTGRQLFYALVFTITFFVAFLYILTVIF
jgi:hypothetical protein